MIRVMIVDDEILVRVGIKSILNWEEHGYTVVGEASSCREAVARLDALRPHIVLTDLMMEGMDGFDLIRRCVQDYPNCRVIVLSSYNDFDNVRRAMKLGAADYIFKLTVKAEELLRVLEEARAGLDTGTTEQHNMVRKNISAIKKRMITAGVQQSYLSAAEFEADFAALGLATDFHKPYAVLRLGIDNYAAERKREGFSQPELLKYSMENIIHEVVGAHHLAEVYNYLDGDLLAVIHPEPGWEAQIEADFDKLAEYMRRYLGIQVSGGLSGTVTGSERLGEAVARATQALESRYLAEPGGLHRWLDTEPECPRAPGTEIQAISDALNVIDFALAKGLCQDLFDDLAQWRGQPVSAIRRRLLHLYSAFSFHAFVAGVEMGELLDDNGLTLHEGIMGYDFLRSVRAGFFCIFEKYLAQRPEALGRCREEVLTVKRHVKRFPGEELSVEQAAAMVSMSKSYFSHIFKKETGMSFVDYVNRTRISRATELLMGTDMRVGEVAAAVGIHNPNYFGILFKKLTGKTPGECREETRESE